MKGSLLVLALAFAAAAVADPNWDLSNTEYTSSVEYTFTTSPFPLSDSDSYVGPVSFGPQDANGNLTASMTIPIGGQVFPITVSGTVNGDTVHLFTPTPLPGPYEYDTQFQIGPILCNLHIVATNVEVDITAHILDESTFDSGDGTITADLDVSSSNCFIPDIDRGYVDITSFTAVGGPAKRYMTLSGTASLQNFAGSPASRPVTIGFSGPTAHTEVVTPGAWSVRVALVPGQYDLDFGALYYLHRKLLAVGLSGDTSGLDATLLGGDASGDNTVALTDLNQTLLGFGGGAPDLDGSGQVALEDLVLVLLNLGETGD